MTELTSYVTRNPAPHDATSVKIVIRYLTACNQLFERGFLSHEKVSSRDSEVLGNIKMGYSFFSTWLKSLLDEGIIIVTSTDVDIVSACVQL